MTAPEHNVTLIFDRLTDAQNRVNAEVTVSVGTTELLSGVDVGLKSDAGHTKLASSLKAVAPSIPWKLFVQRACSLVLQRYRRGEPPQQLTQETPVAPLHYALYPLVLQHKPTILYGDGGLGKSTFALMLAMCVSAGQTVAGFTGRSGQTLYLDYEDDADMHARRLKAIIAGHPELASALVHYQRCVEPLPRLMHTIIRRVHELGITFIVLDSLVTATGGDASAEATTKLFAAMRLLQCEILALGHVPKTQSEGQDHPSVYGSVFNQNFTRSLWELKREQEVGEDSAIIGLFNRKANLSRKHPPIGLQVTQNSDGTFIRYGPFDLSQAAEMAQALPLASRIRNLLQDGELRTSKQIAGELGEKHETVVPTLSKHKGKKWSMVGENRDAKWTVVNP